MRRRRITSGYYNYFYKNKVRLLNMIVSKFQYSNPDELLSIAKTSLLYAMINFDQNIASFNTYLYITVRGNILKHISSEQNLCKNVYEDNTLTQRKVCFNDDRLIVEEILEKLSKRERSILTMYYLENHSLREISEKLNISTNCVYVNRNKALKKIREMYEV